MSVLTVRPAAPVRRPVRLPAPAATWIVAASAVPAGELDIGLLAGPYVAADVLARRLRTEGRRVVLTTGIDDHHPDVVARALRTGRRPDDVAEAFGEAIAADLRHAGVRLDAVARPARDAGHRRRMQAWFRRLCAEGVLVGRTVPWLWCAPCGHWLDGALAAGRCPGCDAAASGGACPSCLRPNEAVELAGVRCAVCGGTPEVRPVAGYVLPLEGFRERLREHWAGLPPVAGALVRWPAEVPATRPGEYGLPVDGARLATAFGRALTHLVAAQTVAADGPYRAVHFLGSRDAALHTLLIPALLDVAGLPLPRHLHISEPYTTGAGRPLWAIDAVADVGADTLRRHVCAYRPVGRPVVHRDRELAGSGSRLTEGWNGWLAGVLAVVRDEHGGRVPDAAPGGAGWRELRAGLERTGEELAQAHEPAGFAPRRVVALLDGVVARAAEFAAVNAPEPDPGRRAAATAAQLTVASALACWAWPLLPQGAGRLAATLGVRAGRPAATALRGPAAGTVLRAPAGPLFGL
ncbi:Methionine--tRNA ligase [Streptomyces sp. RB5]|uniref:Methionine--tRNA ligase n=1 Tax=Streptomyces smaragdinus TaxID=2585196 RepID=A0A7K0CJU2_9ACTN|nr:class I tRNA ligase family protein [Streptomyces smaragdinus]MQY13034.1 Methionine--tRNA ligase [Streptomyces smaragdinus]